MDFTNHTVWATPGSRSIPARTLLLWQAGAPAVLALGTLGNGLVVALLVRLKLKSNFHNFLLVLAVADLLSLFSELLPQGMAVHFHVALETTGKMACKFSEWLGFSSRMVSSWVLVAMVMQRALYELWPYRLRTVDVHQQTESIITGIIFLALICNSHTVLDLSVRNGVCTWSDKFRRRILPKMIWFQLVLYLLAPIVVILLADIVLVKAMRDRNRRVFQRSQMKQMIHTFTRSFSGQTPNPCASKTTDVTQVNSHRAESAEPQPADANRVSSEMKAGVHHVLSSHRPSMARPRRQTTLSSTLLLPEDVPTSKRNSSETQTQVRLSPAEKLSSRNNLEDKSSSKRIVQDKRSSRNYLIEKTSSKHLLEKSVSSRHVLRATASDKFMMNEAAISKSRRMSEIPGTASRRHWSSVGQRQPQHFWHVPKEMRGTSNLASMKALSQALRDIGRGHTRTDRGSFRHVRAKTSVTLLAVTGVFILLTLPHTIERFYSQVTHSNDELDFWANVFLLVFHAHHAMKVYVVLCVGYYQREEIKFILRINKQ